MPPRSRAAEAEPVPLRSAMVLFYVRFLALSGQHSAITKILCYLIYEPAIHAPGCPRALGMIGLR